MNAFDILGYIVFPKTASTKKKQIYCSKRVASGMLGIPFLFANFSIKIEEEGGYCLLSSSLDKRRYRYS
jgi:hypothetical protein